MCADAVRGGDAGMTSLGDGSRVSKDSDRVAAYGAVDELDSFAGLARATIAETIPSSEKVELVISALDVVQHSCWILAARLACPASGRDALVDSLLADVESLASRLAAAAGPVNRFVSPGASRAEASLHVARTVCRRAERQVVALLGPIEPDGSHWEVMLLNRLSGILFNAAMLVLECQGIEPSLRGGPVSKRH